MFECLCGSRYSYRLLVHSPLGKQAIDFVGAKKHPGYKLYKEVVGKHARNGGGCKKTELKTVVDCILEESTKISNDDDTKKSSRFGVLNDDAKSPGRFVVLEEGVWYERNYKNPSDREFINQKVKNTIQDKKHKIKFQQGKMASRKLLKVMIKCL
jgi:hypothetical protein